MRLKDNIVDTVEKEGLSEVFSINSVSENPKSQSFLLIKK